MRFPEEFYDACNQTPSQLLPIQEVTVFNQKIQVPFSDELFGETTALFDTRASVNLRPEQRGIHMSRIEAAFQEVGAHRHLGRIALHIAEEIRRTQEQSEASISLEGDVLIKKQTNVTQRSSLDTIRVIARSHAGSDEKISLGLEATIITACPCMQRYALDEMLEVLDVDVDDPKSLIHKLPVATHSQKGKISMIVTGSAAQMADFPLSCIYTIFKNSSHLTYELLKRPDEYDLVRRAHLRPQFVEDVVRDAMAESVRVLQHHDGALQISLAAESYESIHGHDIAAQISTTLGELRAMLNGHAVQAVG